MGKPSRDKGKVGERELAHLLTEILGVPCRRGVQYQGGPGSPDVVGPDGIHIECKRTERISVYKALDQAIEDAGEKVPVVCHRQSRREWVAILRLEDLVQLTREIKKITKTPKGKNG